MSVKRTKYGILHQRMEARFGIGKLIQTHNEAMKDDFSEVRLVVIQSYEETQSTTSEQMLNSHVIDNSTLDVCEHRCLGF